MRVTRGSAWRVVAVTLGLGIAWLLVADASAAGGVPGATSTGAGVLAAVALVAAASAAAIASSASLRILIATLVALAGASVARAPAERIDLPATITQSRPDAPGRPLPRAPGDRPTVA